jgi:hypothetical protein
MVIAGLDPAIHEATPRAQPQGNTAKNLIMDARVRPAHDESKIGAAGITPPWFIRVHGSAIFGASILPSVRPSPCGPAFNATWMINFLHRRFSNFGNNGCLTHDPE